LTPQPKCCGRSWLPRHPRGVKDLQRRGRFGGECRDPRLLTSPDSRLLQFPVRTTKWVNGSRLLTRDPRDPLRLVDPLDPLTGCDVCSPCLYGVVVGTREHDDRRVVVTIGDQHADVDRRRQLGSRVIHDGHHQPVYARPLAVQLARRRQPTRPAAPPIRQNILPQSYDYLQLLRCLQLLFCTCEFYLLLFVWFTCFMCVWRVYYVFYVVYMGQMPEIKPMMMMMTILR